MDVMGIFQRVFRFIHSVFKWSLSVFLWIFAVVVGLLQAILPLLFRSYDQLGGNMGVIKSIFLFFVTPWPWYWWVIFILGIIIISLGKRAWQLGGFGLELGLTFSSKPLPNSIERFMGLQIENRSPRKVSQAYVTLNNISPSSNSYTKRKDRFRWSAHNSPMFGTKEIIPGYTLTATILHIRKDIDYAVFVLQTREPYQFVPPGNYEIEIEIVGIYNGKRFEMPLKVAIEYKGGLDIWGVHIIDENKIDWRIKKPINIEIMPSEEQSDLPNIVKKIIEWEKKNRWGKEKKKKEKK